MKKIEVSAPGKLMLFGEHAVVYDRPCVVTAVNQRMRIEIEARENGRLEIEAPDVGIIGYSKKINVLEEQTAIPKGVRFLETAVKNFFEKYTLPSGLDNLSDYKVKSGLKMKTKSEFSGEFGFGSSSAVTVAALKGLSSLFKIRMGKRRLFDLVYKTVLDVQGVGSGFDLAAAIWGGTIFFVTDGKKIMPLKVKSLPLVIGYTGIKADTPNLVRQVAELYKSHPKLVKSIFDAIAALTQEAKKALLKSDLKRVGELMNLNQGLLDALGVNTKKLADLIFSARQAGAYGAKLSGAGGGDCMIALIPEKKRKAIVQAIEKTGGKYLKVESNAEGARIE